MSKTFLRPTDTFPPFRVKIFSKYGGETYDDLDAKAEKLGYDAVEPSTDERIEMIGSCGLQNNTLHSGWIATMSDGKHKQKDQIETLRKKLQICKDRGKEVIVGFCQTGHFSIGYSIYVKRD